MSLARFSVNNHVLVNMLMLLTLLGGGIFAFTLVREFFPESRPDKVLIAAVYPGQQPEEVEKAVTIKVEEAVHDVEGIEKVNSTVSDGMSVTILTLYNDADDINVVMQEVKNRVDAIQNLPDDVERVTVESLEPKLPVISVALYGEGSEAELKRSIKALQDDLLRLPGVSDVRISGIRVDEISVELEPSRLLEFDVTFAEVAAAIRQANLDVSGGLLKGERMTFAVRMLGEQTRGVGLEQIVIRSTADGRKVRLSDLATIRDEFVESDLESYFNSKPAAHCVVFKAASQDAIQISMLVKAYVNGKRGTHFDPYGFDTAAWYSRPLLLATWGIDRVLGWMTGKADPMATYRESVAKPFDHSFEVALHTDLARFIEGRLDLMIRNGRVGLLLVLVMLMLFLDWRVAFWVATGLVVSFLGTFFVMWALGETVNLLSMFGLIIVLGIIVDDAIIIGENICRHVESGMPAREAAVKGTDEVIWPVLVTITTTIAAFAPLVFIRGQIGDFMRVLPVVVMAALVVSLLEATVILPAHLSRLKPSSGKAPRGSRWSRWTAWAGWPDRMLRGPVTRGYERLLRVALRWRYVTLAIASATFLWSVGLMAGEIVEYRFIQKMDSETLLCGVEMPIGTPVEQSREQMVRLSTFADDQPEVKNVQMHVARQYDLKGGGMAPPIDQSHLGQLVLELLPADEREERGLRSSDQLLSALRDYSEKLAGVNSVNWESTTAGPGGRDIHIKVIGPRFDQLVEVADELKTRLKQYNGVHDLDDDHDRGKQEIRLRMRDSARAARIDEARLGGFVRGALFGHESRRVSRDREDVKIMVRYPEPFRRSLYNVESMWIPTGLSQGLRGWVSLEDVATVSRAEGFTSLHRSDRQRAVTVYGAVDNDIADSAGVLDRIRVEFEDDLQAEYPGVRLEFLGEYNERVKAFGSLQIAFPVVLVLIYTLLAGLFRSYFQPLVVMMAIPFGLQGAIIGHWLTGNPVTILSQIGFIALAGILVNDSLILVVFINRRMRDGMDSFEASVAGARLRLRAILLTTLTTAAGLTPLMFETSFQAKFLIPMAVTLTFGLIFATALTLIIVPALNLVMLDVKRVLGFEE